MPTIEKAIGIALRAHENAVDKGGAPYILHPLRIMIQMETPEEMMAAVLHDAVEDGALTIDQLRTAGFSENVLGAVESLTRGTDETYENYIGRIKSNPIAVKIKIADLRDNLDVTRINRLSEMDVQRLNRYKDALDVLTGDAYPAMVRPKPRTLYLGEL